MEHLWKRLLAFGRRQAELRERWQVIQRPWTHDELHWHRTEDGQCELHGSHPAARRGRGPVTSGGWCPCREPVMDDDVTLAREPR